MSNRSILFIKTLANEETYATVTKKKWNRFWKDVKKKGYNQVHLQWKLLYKIVWTVMV